MGLGTYETTRRKGRKGAIPVLFHLWLYLQICSGFLSATSQRSPSPPTWIPIPFPVYNTNHDSFLVLIIVLNTKIDRNCLKNYENTMLGVEAERACTPSCLPVYQALFEMFKTC